MKYIAYNLQCIRDGEPTLLHPFRANSFEDAFQITGLHPVLNSNAPSGLKNNPEGPQK